MDLKYLILHKDIWFYRRRFPRKVCQATGKEFFRRSLKLGRQAPIGDIAQAWQIAHEYFEFVIKDPCLDLKDGFRPTNTVNQSGLINPKSTDSESPLLLSQCWDLYAAAREIDINTREGKRIFSRWHKWLTISGDSHLEQRNVESKLDSYQALRLKQVGPSSVKRELNLVMAVIRFAAKSKRVPLLPSSSDLPELPDKPKSKTQQWLPVAQQ